MDIDQLRYSWNWLSLSSRLSSSSSLRPALSYISSPTSRGVHVKYSQSVFDSIG